MAGGGDDEGRWIERLVRLGAALGLNEVRLRWRLMNAERSWERFTRGTRQKVRQVRYEHKVCPRCGAIQDREATRCTSCSSRLRARPLEILSRIGMVAPHQILSPTSLLGAAMVLAYVRMIVAQGGGGFVDINFWTLYRFGARLPLGDTGGQWWRLGSAIFLHSGLWHIGFNLMALSQVGPRVEEVFGRARMLVFFMLTGIVANVASGFFSSGGIGVGASGALMGLVGVTAGWGQRDGTSLGLAVRNAMIQWGLYTIVFGYLIRADNAAHAMGFFSGGILGYFVPPAWYRRQRMGTFLAVSFLLALAAAGISLFFVFFPAQGPGPTRYPFEAF